MASPLVLSGGTLGDTLNNGALTFTAASGTLAQNVTLAVNSPVTISGSLTDSGSGFSLTKNGPGTLTLAGNNTYSGSTSAVNAGTLYINGTNATPSIYVAPGMTLGGSGTAASAAVTVDNNGVLNLSQNTASTLTFSSLTFDNRAAINLPVFTSTATLALYAGTLTPNGFGNSVGFNFPQTTLANGTYRLLGYSGSIGGNGASAHFTSPLLRSWPTDSSSTAVWWLTLMRSTTSSSAKLPTGMANSKTGCRRMPGPSRLAEG